MEIRDVEIKIINELKTKGLGNLSISKVAEWRIWVWSISAVIHAYYMIVQSFMQEIDVKINASAPGTAKWYADQSSRWQFGHQLMYDSITSRLYYAVDDDKSRLISVAAITEIGDRLDLKVAKTVDGKITSLSVMELADFRNYISMVKFIGTKINVISSPADILRYNIDVHHSASIPLSVISDRVSSALIKYRHNFRFDSMFYVSQLVSSLMLVDGVVAAKCNTVLHLYADQQSSVDTYCELRSGYFDFDTKSVINYIAI